MFFTNLQVSAITHHENSFPVFELPEELFNELETAAASHPPKRVVNMSKQWGLGFDVFDEEWPL